MYKIAIRFRKFLETKCVCALLDKQKRRTSGNKSSFHCMNDTIVRAYYTPKWNVMGFLLIYVRYKNFVGQEMKNLIPLQWSNIATHTDEDDYKRFVK